jgi:predicted extracellular nuclease
MRRFIRGGIAAGVVAVAAATALTTAGPAAAATVTGLRIHDIQGAAQLSPYVNQVVGGVPGIVTWVTSNGFYMQDPQPDADPATSEGIFVFRSRQARPAVGDAVSMTGKVQEFTSFPTSNLDVTELSSTFSTDMTVVSHGNPLPDATIVGAGGRIPPTQVVENDATGNVNQGADATFDPAEDGMDFWESLESMRVQVAGATAVGPTNKFDELPVVADGGAEATSVSPRGGLVLQPDDQNPERITLAPDLLGGTVPTADVGAAVSPAIGIIGFDFSNYRLMLTQPAVATQSPITREVARPAGEQELSIGNWNLENLSAANPSDAARMAREAGYVVNNLASPDILTVQEIQDNDGVTDDGVVAANQTLDTLVADIVAAGGPQYAWRSIDPQNDTDGGVPGGNIRQAFLYRTDIDGLLFIDRPGGDATTATKAVRHGFGADLTLSPGRVAPTDAAWADSRKPLAGEFKFHGRTVFVITNHFDSKGGDTAFYGPTQPPVLSSEPQRIQQAQLVRDFVKSIQAIDPSAEVVVTGDLNDFQFSTPIRTLVGDDLVDLPATLPANERYTYNYEGNSEVLDHIIVTPNLAPGLSYDVVHLDSEFADQVSDHDPQVAYLDLKY